MKKNYALAIIAFLMLSFNAVLAQSPDPVIGPQADGAVIEFEKETLNFGTLPHQGDASGDFVVWNRGTQDLVITFCKGSCGCTVPQCPTEAIKPGSSAKIHVKYDSNRVGSFTKNVTVTSNAINAPNKTLTISGTINAPVTPPNPTPTPDPNPTPQTLPPGGN